MATVDALVIGRKTFETVLTLRHVALRRQAGVRAQHAARSPPPRSGPWWSGCRAIQPTSLSQLAARGIRHVYVDGGITIQRFLQAGLIQRLIITRVPVLIGAGIPLFGALQRDIVLTHVATRQYASGLVQSEYLVAA